MSYKINFILNINEKLSENKLEVPTMKNSISNEIMINNWQTISDSQNLRLLN